MHMADALISPVVGVAMLAVGAGVGIYSVKKVQNSLDEKKIPLMGVMGAFVFVAQMINFTIPGTGSSGHIGGGILLAILLGRYAGFLTMASILVIQALFFGDGGLLAIGANVVNLGVFSCFVAYPLIYKWFTKKELTKKRIFIGSIISVIVALSMGSFSVVLETLMSGKTELPFITFALFMQGIHLLIGSVEGVITGAVVVFVWNARPEILENSEDKELVPSKSIKKVLAILLVATLFIGGTLSWFASNNPDGLEWSIEKSSGIEELESSHKVHKFTSNLQEKTSILPDYGFENSKDVDSKIEEAGKQDWSVVDSGKSVSGIIGGLITLVIVIAMGMVINMSKRKRRKITV